MPPKKKKTIKKKLLATSKNTRDIEADTEGKHKVQSYEPTRQERIVGKYVEKRKDAMKEYRKSLKIEKMWAEADKEYIPGEIDMTKGHRKRFEQDQETGLRSRMVSVGAGDEDVWRSQGSDPTLLVKIMTAMAIIIDKNPEAVLTAMLKKYESTSDLANSIWKRSWEITNSKENLKLFVLNLCKYGWSVGRTYPKKLEYIKQILEEVSSEGKKYKDETKVLYNDLCRETLNPKYTWIDENTSPYDSLSMNDCYYEVEYSYDRAKAEFGKYPNFDKYAKKGVSQRDKSEDKVASPTEEEPAKKRDDMLIMGFYENRLKDLYVVYIPEQKVVVYNSPLPNDDGMLSLWHTMWVLRSSTSPFGVSLWEIIRNDKRLYDKMSNMTMDQLVLSIMKMFFYTGTSNALGDGKIVIKPGIGKQIVNGKVDFLEIPGPGEGSWKGLQYEKSRMDDNSGITPTLEGEVTGKTLGEIMQAKEQALKRLKIPLENIADAIEQDAYLTISWASQIYSVPELKEFTDMEELQAFEKDNEIENGGVFQEQTPEGEPVEGANIKAAFFPQLALHLEDSDGKLKESKESQFFQVGEEDKDGKVKSNQIKTGWLKWKGVFRVLPKSILSPSLELEKIRKMELFNIIVPLLSQPKEIYAKPVKQIIKVNEEDPDDWLPDEWLSDSGPDLFSQSPPPGPPGAAQGFEGVIPGQGQSAPAPNQGGPTVVPGSQLPPGLQPKQFSGARQGDILNKRI